MKEKKKPQYISEDEYYQKQSEHIGYDNSAVYENVQEQGYTQDYDMGQYNEPYEDGYAENIGYGSQEYTGDYEAGTDGYQDTYDVGTDGYQDTYGADEYQDSYEAGMDGYEYQDDYDPNLDSYQEDYGDYADYAENDDNNFEESFVEPAIKLPVRRKKDKPARKVPIQQIIGSIILGAGLIAAAILVIFLVRNVLKLVRGEIDPLGFTFSQTSESTFATIEGLEIESMEQTESNGLMGTEQQEESMGATPEDEPEIYVSKDVPEVAKICRGVDVSKYQGVINWEKVANSGIEFAMIRVGFRTLDTGEIKEDEFGRYNLQEAIAHGIKVGVYFFSTAVSEEEAVKEANWLIDIIKNYQITYPVAYNCEGFHDETNRQYAFTKEERTQFAKAFLDTVYQAGYTPMFYGPSTEISEDKDWMTSELQKHYKVWVSSFAGASTGTTEKPDYDGTYAMWQYTCEGKVDGVQGNVDLDMAYFGYESVAAAHDQTTEPVYQLPDYESIMDFSDTNEEVTAKVETNLRNIPDQGEHSEVKYVLKNGEIATRTGVSENGWSRVVFQGNTYYAVTQYLTPEIPKQSDTTEQAPEVTEVQEDMPEDSNGIKTVFTECNEQVTPKIEVNLRLLPSVTNPDATVIATIRNGEVVTRTGINEQYGWSRVEYNGQTLYCVSSYLKTP